MKIKQIGKLNLGIGISMAIITTSYSIFTSQSELFAQSILGAGIALMQITLGIKLIKTKESSPIPPQIKVIKYEKEKPELEIDKSDLSENEKSIIFKLEKRKEILQSELMEELNINKVKMSRVLKKLEEKDLIEKKKKGMNNLIVLK